MYAYPLVVVPRLAPRSRRRTPLSTRRTLRDVRCHGGLGGRAGGHGEGLADVVLGPSRELEIRSSAVEIILPI